ncbi:MAG: hypothetical protein DSY82_07050 [Flavobacteriia bacterium]|nr:MAG: hypothetical protein DSY82_07050 [Flavobacteriia bacterium]
MKKIIVILFLTILFRNGINAQIVYTDITDGVPTQIDFNNDGKPEFDISQNSTPGDFIEYYDYGDANNIHAIGTQDTADWDVPDCVEADYIVDASSNWEGQGDCSLDAWGAGNSTIAKNHDQYLAVRFNLGTNAIYYGWIRFTMDDSGAITYKDFAYESTPEKAIKTGTNSDVLATDKFSRKNTIEMFPNPATDFIAYTSPSDRLISKITISNLLGKKIKTIPSKHEYTNSIAINNLRPGIYIVSFYDKNDTVIGFKKLIIQK